MNLPEWVDPTSPDDPRAAAAAPGREDGGLPLGVEDPELAEKPVLEWTKDDWARWVLGSVTEAEADARAAPGRQEEVRAAAVVAEPGDDHVGPVDDDGPDQPIVDIRLPEEDDLLDPPPALPGDDAGWDPPPPAALALDLDDDEPAPAPVTGPRLFGPRPPQSAQADLRGDTDPPEAGAAERPDEDRPWDDEAEFDRRADLWAGQGTPASVDDAAEREDEAWRPSGDRWSGARSAAAALDPDTLAIPVATPEEASAALEPAPAPRPADIADPSVDQRPAPAAPARRADRAWSRLAPAPVEDEKSRRVRSLIGLLCIAVTVGVIIAALITVTIVALGLALRRAVG